ncbi:MAG: hypothetical protein AAFN93_20770, partial [Bacteroidota bacterium]
MSPSITPYLAGSPSLSPWGLEYQPVDYFKVRFGPFSPRVTIVSDDDVAINGERDGEPARYGVIDGD